MCGDHTKIEEALLLKFKKKKKNKGKNIKHLKICHNCNKLNHWENNFPYFKKLLKSTRKTSNFKNKLVKSLVKEKEEPFELDQTINAMEEELNEITYKESEFFLESSG